jgi:hypothetical protein
MPDEAKHQRNSAAQNERCREHIPRQRNAHEKYQCANSGEKRAGDTSVYDYLRYVDLRVANFFWHATPRFHFIAATRLSKALPGVRKPG